MAELNPFYEDEEFSVDHGSKSSQFDEITLNSDERENEIPIVTENITLDAIANCLLKQNFLLTALELHIELVEARKEIPRLRDFFSNPGNFERSKLTPEGSPSCLRKCSKNSNKRRAIIVCLKVLAVMFAIYCHISLKNG